MFQFAFIHTMHLNQYDKYYYLLIYIFRYYIGLSVYHRRSEHQIVWFNLWSFIIAVISMAIQQLSNIWTLVFIFDNDDDDDYDDDEVNCCIIEQTFKLVCVTSFSFKESSSCDSKYWGWRGGYKSLHSRVMLSIWIIFIYLNTSVVEYSSLIFPTNPSLSCNAVFGRLLFDIRIASIEQDMLRVVTYLSASFMFKHTAIVMYGCIRNARLQLPEQQLLWGHIGAWLQKIPTSCWSPKVLAGQQRVTSQLHVAGLEHYWLICCWLLLMSSVSFGFCAYFSVSCGQVITAVQFIGSEVGRFVQLAVLCL